MEVCRSTIIDYAIGSLDTNFMKFGSVYETAREGGTPTTSNTSFYNNGKIPFIKIGDLKQKYLIENKDFITELGLQKSSAWLVPTHSILFSNGATIGEITITTYPVCTKQGILGIVPKANIDVEFLYYFMSSSYFKKAVSRIITEGTMKTAYLRNIDNILCPIPTKEKQLKIAKVPSALNLKIDSEQSILRLLYAQKRYLLHQMFRWTFGKVNIVFLSNTYHKFSDVPISNYPMFEISWIVVFAFLYLAFLFLSKPLCYSLI